MTIAGVFSAIFVGLIIGALGRLLAPGRQRIPVWLTIVVGIIAAMLGTALVGSLSNTKGMDWIELIVQVLLAAVGVSLVAKLRSRRRGLFG